MKQKLENFLSHSSIWWVWLMFASITTLGLLLLNLNVNQFLFILLFVSGLMTILVVVKRRDDSFYLACDTLQEKVNNAKTWEELESLKKYLIELMSSATGKDQRHRLDIISTMINTRQKCQFLPKN